MLLPILASLRWTVLDFCEAGLLVVVVKQEMGNQHLGLVTQPWK